MKKLIVTILTVVFVLTLAFSVIGCGGDNGGSTCRHKLSSNYISVDNEYHKSKCTLCNEYVNEKHKWEHIVDDGNTPIYNCQKCGVPKA